MSISTTAKRQAVRIETSMSLLADQERFPVRAELAYSSDQPFAVTLSLTLGDAEPVEWIFARELLMQGVRLPAGYGDIQIFPTLDGIAINLQSPDGDACLIGDADDLTTFADAVAVAVPEGTEGDHFSIDAELTALMAFSWEYGTER